MKKFALLAICATPMLVSAMSNEQLANKIAGSESVYVDVIEINYLKKIRLDLEKDWIGQKVFKQDGTCFIVKKEMKNKKIKEPFKGLYNSAKLPETINLGVIKQDVSIVDCSNYESGSVTIQ